MPEDGAHAPAAWSNEWNDPCNPRVGEFAMAHEATPPVNLHRRSASHGIKKKARGTRRPFGRTLYPEVFGHSGIWLCQQGLAAALRHSRLC